jgi:hypothetical protein
MTIHPRSIRDSVLIVAVVALAAFLAKGQVAQGAILVTHAISDKYAALGGPTGLLGQPLGSEQVALDGVGHFQDFQNGSIYWSPISGSHSVFGAIRKEFITQHGGPDGTLGYPISDDPLPTLFHGDVLLCPVDANGHPEGRVVRFEGGIIYSDDLCVDQPQIVAYSVPQMFDQVFHADHGTQHAHLKPYKGFVSLYGRITCGADETPPCGPPIHDAHTGEDNYPIPADNPTYTDFLHIGDQGYDGDITFNFDVDWPATLAADPTFWDRNPQFGPSWYNNYFEADGSFSVADVLSCDPTPLCSICNPITCLTVGQLLPESCKPEAECCSDLKAECHVNRVHGEVIMYGLYDARADLVCFSNPPTCTPVYPVLADNPPFLPGWAQHDDNSTRVTNFITGFNGPINGNGALLHQQVPPDSYVRVTGVFATDCHGLFGDCGPVPKPAFEDGDNVEVHQVDSIDVVQPGIATKYAALGGLAGFLGLPLDAPIITPVGVVIVQQLAPDGVGLLENFQGGTIVWSPDIGAHDLFGPVLTKWIQIGGVTSPLGYPTADEQTPSDGRLVSDFQGGTISFSPRTGTVVTDRSLIVTPAADQTVVEGAAGGFDVGAFDASVGGSWSVDVNWGDGSSHAGFAATSPGALPAQSHAFAEEGNYTVTVTVTDTADGATASGSFLVNVIVTPASIVSDVRQLIDIGKISQHEGRSLVAKLNNAAALRARGKCTTAGSMYQAFINEVRAQSGRKVAAIAAGSIIGDAQFLMANCS